MINDVIDLRSDTLTVPTPQMREAMAAAEVGDDVYNEDPTVNRLQEMAAARLGKEAALFVSSGTQGNLVALLSHCIPSEEMIVGDQTHIFLYEAGGSAALGGIHPRALPNQADGTLKLDDIRGAIRPNDPHYPITRLICLENTHNRMYGTPLTPDYTRQVADIAHSFGGALHIDGARLFNAAVALNVDARELVRDADSVTFCLSKGLGAPVGSLLCGSKAFIAKAYRKRKMLGGAMRQIGIMAAAGIVALDQMVDRLAEDHANAKAFAQGLSQIAGISIEVNRIRSNLVFFELAPDAPIDAPELCRRAAANRVRMGAQGARRVRAVMHCWVTRAEVEQALQVISHAMQHDAPRSGASLNSPYK